MGLVTQNEESVTISIKVLLQKSIGSCLFLCLMDGQRKKTCTVYCKQYAEPTCLTANEKLIAWTHNLLAPGAWANDLSIPNVPVCVREIAFLPLDRVFHSVYIV